MMLYTIGDRLIYEPGFDGAYGPTTFRKMGRQGGYGGGSIFLSVEEAEDCLTQHQLHDYRVYGVLTDIENTYLVGGNRYLIKSAPLVRL